MYELKSGFRVLRPFMTSTAPPTEIALSAASLREKGSTTPPISGKAGDWIVVEFQEEDVVRRAALIATSAEGSFDMNLQLGTRYSSHDYKPIPSREIKPRNQTGPGEHAMERRIALSPFSMGYGTSFVVIVATSDFRDLTLQVKPRATGRNPTVGNTKDTTPRAPS